MCEWWTMSDQMSDSMGGYIKDCRPALLMGVGANLFAVAWLFPYVLEDNGSVVDYFTGWNLLLGLVLLFVFFLGMPAAFRGFSKSIGEGKSPRPGELMFRCGVLLLCVTPFPLFVFLFERIVSVKQLYLK
jgi:hypothetical protein